MMGFKDYYQILQIAPHADQTLIKKAFRKLAMQYHPDKSEPDKINDTERLFREIKEAYEILSDPLRREQYHYDRWLHQFNGNHLNGLLSGYQVYQDIIESEKYLSGIDQFRKNHFALLNLLLSLFSIARIQLILAEKNVDLEEKTIEMAIKMSATLNSECQIQLKERLNQLLKVHPMQTSIWELKIKQKIISERNATLKIPIILTIVLILCLLFYYYGKK